MPHLPGETLDTEQQNKLIKEYDSMVVHIVNAMILERPQLLHRTEREDLLQEGRYGLALATRDYDADKAKFKTWAWHCIVKALRAAIKSLDLNADFVSFDECHSESTPRDADPALQAEANIINDEVFSKVSTNHGGVLKRLYHDEYSQADIARQQHISPNAVSQVHQRALGKAREAVGVSI